MLAAGLTVKAQANRRTDSRRTGVPRQTRFSFGGAKPWRTLFMVQAFPGPQWIYSQLLVSITSSPPAPLPVEQK